MSSSFITNNLTIRFNFFLLKKEQNNGNLKTDKYRIETELRGDIEVTSTAYFGAQTQRAKNNFPISGYRIPPEFIYVLGIIKKAAAYTNSQLGLLEKNLVSSQYFMVDMGDCRYVVFKQIP